MTTALPKYEPPLTKRDFQNVRTTAYTHTESDHLAYGRHNALGGQLHAATGAIRRAEYVPRAEPVTSPDVSDFRRVSYSPSAALQPFSLESRTTTKLVKTKHGTKRVTVTKKPQIGSAAIDWNLVVFHGLTIKGIYGREMFETWYKMTALIQSGLDISPVITHRFPYAEFHEGFELMKSGNSGKIILDWAV